MNTIWILSGTYDEAGPLRAYRDKTRAEQDLALLKLLPEDNEFVLKELPIFDGEASASPPAEAPKRDRLPSVAFADSLIETFGFDGLPETIDDLSADFPKPKNTRTQRAGIELALQRRQKSRAAAPNEQGDLATERTAREASPSLPPESDGAGDNQQTAARPEAPE